MWISADLLREECQAFKLGWRWELVKSLRDNTDLLKDLFLCCGWLILVALKEYFLPVLALK
jgi:hypothetical protein